MAAFEDIRKRASLIFVSHNLKTLRQSCQSALFLRDGKADFYPDINEGIEAYMDYTRLLRKKDLPKQSPEFIARKLAKKAAAKAAKAARRLAKQQRKRKPDETLPPN